MRRLLVVLAVVSATTYAGYRVLGGSERPAAKQASEQIMLDRIWIEKLPRNERDVIQIFLAISDQSFGVFQASSAWKGSFEIFRFEARGGELRVVYPQTGERESVKARATKCNEHGMDFCLELDGSSRGIKRYYSRKGWEIDGAASLDAARAKIEALVRTDQ